MNYLKQIREDRKVTQKVLALALHVDQSTISKWEDGKHDPNIEVVKEICDYFGIDLDAFYGFDSKTEKKIPIYLKPRLSDLTTQCFSVSGTISFNYSSKTSSKALLFEEGKSSSAEIESKIFSFYLESNDMNPYFSIGDMIFVEEGVLPINQGNIVVAEADKPFRIAHASRFGQTIFLYFLDGSPNLSLDWPLENDSEIRIVGKVLECRRRFNHSF